MSLSELTTLYRPVGQAELDLIKELGKFPPRLAMQPIFYPVLSEAYAIQIASTWNLRDASSGFAGYVTEFEVETEFLNSYEVQRAGSDAHLEYWIPAEDLEEFNRHIVGEIKVTHEFR